MCLCHATDIPVNLPRHHATDIPVPVNLPRNHATSNTAVDDPSTLLPTDILLCARNPHPVLTPSRCRECRCGSQKPTCVPDQTLSSALWCSLVGPVSWRHSRILPLVTTTERITLTRAQRSAEGTKSTSSSCYAVMDSTRTSKSVAAVLGDHGAVCRLCACIIGHT